MKKTAQVARIGFEVPDRDFHNVTGFCAAEMAIDAANESMNLPFRVELVPLVDERDPERARQVARDFVADPTAVGVLGPLNSAMAVANQPIYAGAEVAQLTSEASTPLLTEQGYRNFRRLVANDKVQGRALAQVAVLYLRSQRIAVIDDATAWGKPIATIFSGEAERLGAKPVVWRSFGEAETTLDFGKLVQTVVDADPDLVYFAVYWNKAHIIAHKLRYAGLRATFLGSDALKPFPFLEVPSLDVVKPYHTLAGVDMRIKPSAQAFFRAFAARHPMLLVAPQYAAEAYDCASLLIEALRRAGTVDRKKVLQELQRIEHFEGAIGAIHFDANGDLVDPEIGLYQCVDGLRMYVGTVRDLV
ncbi:MAG: branched-chain amino acid ABC transporter substrate-binding protein [Anaerolineae bacterium]